MPNSENVTTKFRVDISDLKKNIAEANRQLKSAQAEFKNATAGMQKGEKTVDSLSAQIKAQEKAVESEKAKLSALKAELERYTANVTKGSQVIADLTAKHDAAAREYGEESEQAKKLAKQLDEARAAQERNKTAVENLSTQIINQDTKLKAASSALKEYDSELAKAQSASGQLSSKIKNQQTELQTLKDKYKNVALTQGTTSTEARELAAKIKNLSTELQDNKKKLNDSEQAADRFDRSLEEVGDAADKTTQGGLGAFSVALGNLASQVITKALDKIKQLVSETVNVGMSFDSQMSKVKAISGATAEDMERLESKASQLGESTKYTATEVGAAMEAMARAGWKTEDILNAIDGVMNLAAASGEDLASVTSIVTGSMAAFGLETNEMINGVSASTHVADLLAAASSNANTDVKLMGETFKYVAPVAGALGYSMEDAAQAIGILANSNLQGSQAGTILRGSINALIDPTDEATKKMKELGFFTSQTVTEWDSNAIAEQAEKVRKAELDVSEATLRYSNVVAKSGEDSIEAANALESLSIKQNAAAKASEILAKLQAGESVEIYGYNQAIENEDGTMKSFGETLQFLREHMKDMSAQEKALAASTIFGQKAMGGMLKLIDTSDEDFDKLNTAIENCDGAAKDMAETMNDNLGGDITLMQSKIEILEKKLFDKFEPYLRSGMDWLSKKLDEVYPKLETAADFVVEKVVPKVESFVSFVENHGEVIASVIAGIGAAFVTYKIVGTLQAVFAALSSIIGLIKAGGILSLISNPLGLALAAVAALVIGLTTLYAKSEKFRNAVNLTFEVIKNVFLTLKGMFEEGVAFMTLFWLNKIAMFKRGLDYMPEYFKRKFSEAYENVKSTFSGIGSFFGGIWNTVKGKFRDIGTKVGEVIGGAFKAAINAVLAKIENGLNFIPNAINGALHLINQLPNVNIPALPTFELPRLMAKGGIVTRATNAIVGEGGENEAVIPLRTGIPKIAAALARELGTQTAASPSVANTYNFYQTNNSPKALSRWEIYRQTRNQLRFVKGF